MHQVQQHVWWKWWASICICTHISVFCVMTTDKMADMSPCPYTYYLFCFVFFTCICIIVGLTVMSTDSIWTSVFGLSPTHTEEANLLSLLFSSGSNIIIRPQISLSPSRCGRQRDVLLTQGSRWITEASALCCMMLMIAPNCMLRLCLFALLWVM